MNLQQLADNVYVILSAYLLAFLPWTILDSADFIGPEWKSIAATRRQGTIHVIVVMLPITYIIFYLTVQAATRDFKEMFASFVAFLFSIIHLMRTVWGLLQINELHTWVANSIQNMRHMGIHYKPSPKHHISKESPLKVAERFLINETLVDNQISNGDTQTYIKYGSLSLRISNTSRSFFTQRAMFLFRLCIIVIQGSIDFLSYLRTGVKVRKLHQVPHNPIQVWLRWSSALIAQGFGHWVEQFNAPLQPPAQVPTGTPQIQRHFMQRRDYFAGELLSSAAFHLRAECAFEQDPIKKVAPDDFSPSKKRSSVFLWEEWDFHSDVRDGRLHKNDLFLGTVRSGIGLPFSFPHFKTLDKNPNNKTVEDNGYGPYAFNLKRIIESLPVEFGEAVSNLDTAKLDWFAILLNLGARAESHRQKATTQIIPKSFDEVLKTTDPALENLRDQLGFVNCDLDGEVQVPRDAIHISNLCSFPITDRCLTLRSDANRLVMKVGELIDVWMSLTAGEQYDFLLSKAESWAQRCLYDSQMKAVNRGNSLPGMTRSSDHIKDAEVSIPDGPFFNVHKSAEQARLMIQFAKSGHRYEHLEQTITFMGYAMENVRTYLARWRHDFPGTTADVWEPQIEYSERSPLVSNIEADVTHVLEDFMSEISDGTAMHYFLGKGVQNQLIWKMQTEFQNFFGKKGGSPTSEVLMMLCILAFPSLRVDVSCEFEKKTKKSHSLFRRKQKDSPVNFIKINIRPSCAPQKLYVSVHCEKDPNGDFKAYAALAREDTKTDGTFLWESWRDSFTARLQAKAEWQKNHNFPSTDVVRSSCSIFTNADRITTGSVGTGDEVSRWLGWLPFRFEFCRHEVEHLEFLKQYPRRSNLQVDFTSRLDHQQSTARFPGYELVSFRYEDSDPEYLMYACSVVQDYLTYDTHGPIETNEHLGEEVRRMLHKPREYFNAGARTLHRAVILLEIAAVELGNPAALHACVMHLTEHYHIAADFSRAVELLERCVAKFYFVQRNDRLAPDQQFGIRKTDIERTYEYLMSKHGYEANVFWSYFKFLDLMSSGDLNSSSLQSMMRRTFMHTKDYDIVFELGQFPASNMSSVSQTFGTAEHQHWQDVEFAFYDRAITEGRSARSMFELGRMYEKGKRGFEVDEARAAALYHMAIAHGHTSGSKRALGNLYLRGAPQLSDRQGDLRAAVGMYWRAVTEDNDGEAMYELGNLYHFGDSLSKDPTWAAALYQGAILQVHDFRAMRRLASMYHEGNGVSKNPTLSIMLYQSAIDVGDDNDSRAQLAMLLLEGDEEQRDVFRGQSLRQHLQRQGMMTPRTPFPN